MDKEILIKLLALLPELIPELAAVISSWMQAKGVDVVALLAAAKQDDQDALDFIDAELAKFGQ